MPTAGNDNGSPESSSSPAAVGRALAELALAGIARERRTLRRRRLRIDDAYARLDRDGELEVVGPKAA